MEHRIHKLVGRSILILMLIGSYTYPAFAAKQRSQEEEREASELRMMAMGVGAKECHVWTKDRATNAQEGTRDISWVVGFMSGYNFRAMRIVNSGWTGELDESYVADWIDEYCKKHPSYSISLASMNLILNIFAKRNAILERSFPHSKGRTGHK